VTALQALSVGQKSCKSLHMPGVDPPSENRFKNYLESLRIITYSFTKNVFFCLLVKSTHLVCHCKILWFHYYCQIREANQLLTKQIQALLPSS
jgi:hypothetical protein